jgi:hypothetical protein
MDFFDSNIINNNNNNNFDQILQITNDTAFSSSSSSSLLHFQEYNCENYERLTNTAINNFFSFQNDIQLNSYLPTYYQNRENENFCGTSNTNTTCDIGTSMLTSSNRTGNLINQMIIVF